MTAPLDNKPIVLGDLLPDTSLDNIVAGIVVSGISIDSRHIKQSYVFVATQGVNTHGEVFIEQAVNNGAVAVFIETAESTCSINNEKTQLFGVPVLCIPNMNNNLSNIAGRFFNHPSQRVPLIGITGTNGKTTCAQLFAQLSALSQQKSGVVGTVGYGICSANDDMTIALPLTFTGMTTPDAVTAQRICAELINDSVHNIVMEVSSHGLEQARVAALAFDIAVFTNLTHDHLDYHGDMTAYGNAKALLFSMPSLSKIVINIDDEFSHTLRKIMNPDAHLVTYSLSDSSADIYLSDIVERPQFTEAVLHLGHHSYPIHTQLVGRFNLSNLLAVVGVMYQSSALLGVDMVNAIDLIAKLQSVSGRMESIENNLGVRVVVDYAHTPDALENALQALDGVRSNAAGSQIVCVFGCGGDRDKNKRHMMASIAESYADIVIVTNDNPRTEDPESIVRDILLGFSEEKHRVILDRKDAITTAIDMAAANDIVLIAGKGHEDYQLIGTHRHFFSDQQVARSALREKELAA